MIKIDDDLDFYYHFLKAGCMFLFLVPSQRVFYIQFYHDFHLILFRVSWLSSIIYSFHHPSFATSAVYSKNSYLLFKVIFDNYELILGILYLFLLKYLSLSLFLYLAVQIYLFILLNLQFTLSMNFLPFCKILLVTLVLIIALRFYLLPFHQSLLMFCINVIFLFEINLEFHIFALNFSLNLNLLAR